MQQINDSNSTFMHFIDWICLEQDIQKTEDVKLSSLAQKIYNYELPSFEPTLQIKKYKDYLLYEKSNFHGGCNDKLMTKYEIIFHHMYPQLQFQKIFGTGNGGYKKYGVKKYVADFIDNDCKVIIEIDGENHKNELQRLKDNIRDIFFLERGYVTVRFTNEEVLKLYKIYCNKIAMDIENEQRILEG